MYHEVGQCQLHVNVFVCLTNQVGLVAMTGAVVGSGFEHAACPDRLGNHIVDIQAVCLIETSL
jgi:hypothetical protein